MKLQQSNEDVNRNAKILEVAYEVLLTGVHLGLLPD